MSPRYRALARAVVAHAPRVAATLARWAVAVGAWLARYGAAGLGLVQPAAVVLGATAFVAGVAGTTYELAAAVGPWPAR